MGAGIMFVCEGNALLLRRAPDPHDEWSGCWNFPGGSSEMGESPLQTAVREVSEEIGAVPSYKIWDHVCVPGYTLFIAQVFRPFTPSLNREHTHARWVPLSEILSYPLHIKDRLALGRYF